MSFHLGGQAKDALGILEHYAPGFGQRDLPVTALKQARVELLFQLFDLERDRRLRHEQRLGRLGEREVFCDRVKDLEAPVGHDLFKHKKWSALQTVPRGTLDTSPHSIE